MLQVTVENLDSFLAAFTKAPEAMARECRKAVKKGLSEIQLEAATNHSYVSRTGALDKAYRIKVSQDGLDGVISLDGRVSGAPYAYIQHEGTDPKNGGKVVKPTTRKALRWIDGNAFVFAKSIKLGAIKGGKFLTNAGEKLGPKILEDINRAIARALKNAGF